MTYYEIKIECEPGNTENAENFLVINGICDYFVTDPEIGRVMTANMPWLLKDGPEDEKAYITVCVSDKDAAESLFKLISAEFNAVMRLADETEWKDNWKQFASPVHINENLVIKPAWVDYEPKPGEKIIVLDSGAAFGTGTHETTRLCGRLLSAPSKLYPSDPRNSAGWSMLDIGTGSGILAIIGANSGASRITAADIDAVAVETAKINIEKNGFSGIAEVLEGDLLNAASGKYGVITANIIADVLIVLLKNVKNFLNANGILILSGILEERAGEIISAALEQGFELKEKMSENDWVALALRSMTYD
jgi:ribosomal protein L11 methyltransferase